MNGTQEARLLQLIAADRFTAFRHELGEYTASVNVSNPESLQRALTFLHSALVASRAKRAHYSREIEELSAERRFFGRRLVAPTVDISG
jgi:hypothetical protein